MVCLLFSCFSVFLGITCAMIHVLNVMMWFFLCQMTADGEMHSLEIPQVLASDAGKYLCIASNLAGKEMATCSLIVKRKGSSNDDQTDFRSVLKARWGFGILSCTLGYVGEIKMNVRCLHLAIWGFGHSLSLSSLLFHGDYRPGITKFNSSVAQTAPQMDFRNILKSRDSQPPRKPLLIQKLKDCSLDEGQNLQLKCKASVESEVSVTWMYNDKPLHVSWLCSGLLYPFLIPCYGWFHLSRLQLGVHWY